MKNVVTIQLKKDEIWINIMDNAKEKEIEECLKKKIVDLRKLYKGEHTPIRVVGKVLTNKEIEQVQKIIQKELDVNVEFESPKQLGLYGIKKTFNREIEDSNTKFYKGSLRSGVRLEYEGSIVVLGDVNSGAEVIASDNIVVLGSLRGLAHAGAKGNLNAFVAANMIDCPQLRIANKIKELEKNYTGAIKNYAYVNIETEEIILE